MVVCNYFQICWNLFLFWYAKILEHLFTDIIGVQWAGYEKDKKCSNKSEIFWASWDMLFKTCFSVEWLKCWYFIHILFICIFYIIIHGFYIYMNFDLIDFSLKSMFGIICSMMLKNLQIYESTFYLFHNLLTVTSMISVKRYSSILVYQNKNKFQ